MELILPYQIQPLAAPLNHHDKILMLGSCFSEHIGSKLESYKWKVLSNPTGTLFNPISILKNLEGNLEPTNLVEQNGFLTHWDTHGSLRFTSGEEAIRIIEATNSIIQAWTNNASWIMLTPGTAFVYELISTGQIVANCHKIPQTKFRKRLLTVDEITSAFQVTHQKIRSANPKVKWLLTVSPVKHIRDGLRENHISKGILLQAVNEITAAQPDVYYFPAYELVTDVLRDYRFFEPDMAHPNALAIDYIWEQFSLTCLSENARAILKEWEPIKGALNHRPLFPESQEHQAFIRGILEKLEALSSKMDVSREQEHFQNQLNTK